MGALQLALALTAEVLVVVVAARPLLLLEAVGAERASAGVAAEGAQAARRLDLPVPE